MSLPIWPPYPPMEGSSAEEIPTGPQWQYEPKWDGFRCLAFRDGPRVELQSKAMKPLARYFPELVDALKDLKAARFALDGEIVIPVANGFSFDDLLQRIHPAASRIAKLSAERPARLILFDLLVDARGKNIALLPLAKRREALEAFAKKFVAKNSRLSLSPAARSVSTTKRWAKRAGNSLDGIIAKRVDLQYRSGERDGMQKVKRMKTADCVVGGFRYASKKKTVGSLLLGLYNEQGLLDHVGFVATGKNFGTAELTRKLERLIKPPGFTGNAPGGPSRWSTERSSQWEPLRSKLVVEVQFDHVTGGRFRHGTKFLRWRPDKTPAQCTCDQIAVSSGAPLLLVRPFQS
jgi:ATP-dependent DNA ligase